MCITGHITSPNSTALEAQTACWRLRRFILKTDYEIRVKATLNDGAIPPCDHEADYTQVLACAVVSSAPGACFSTPKEPCQTGRSITHCLAIVTTGGVERAGRARLQYVTAQAQCRAYLHAALLVRIATISTIVKERATGRCVIVRKRGAAAAPRNSESNRVEPAHAPTLTPTSVTTTLDPTYTALPYLPYLRSVPSRRFIKTPSSSRFDLHLSTASARDQPTNSSATP